MYVGGSFQHAPKRRRYPFSVSESERPTVRVSALFQLGWFRWLPTAAIDVDGLLHACPGEPRDEAGQALALLHARRGGLKLDEGDDAVKLEALQRLSATLPPAPAWHDPTQDIDLATLDDPADVEAERAEHAELVAQHDAMLAKAGLAPARTVDDVIGLMIRFGLITVEGEQQRLTLATDPPLPTEVLPLSEEEKQREDSLRWRSRFGRLSQRVLRLFLTEQGDLAKTRMTTTVDRIAVTLEADPDAVRQAILVLIDEGDFTVERQSASIDIERLAGHQRFDLVVDPVKFGERGSYRVNAKIERDDA
ncbi:hypothetical protein GCM10010109_65490 [Actinoplanes campanulatus]|nr:hypothetical protein GCM10010109_65490 [Actinoplanes campanulatus]GID39605.1 hypothetical protein Aca09nite_61110 [Actinoplanes campanulatus]